MCVACFLPHHLCSIVPHTQNREHYLSIVISTCKKILLEIEISFLDTISKNEEKIESRYCIVHLITSAHRKFLFFFWHENNRIKKRIVAYFRYHPLHEIATYGMAFKKVEHTYGADLTQCNKQNPF